MVASTTDLLGWLRKHLEAADTALLRELVLGVVQALMSAEADAACGATLGERSAERINQRNGYRPRRLDTRVGTFGVGDPDCGLAATSRTGCCSHDAGPTRMSGWTRWRSGVDVLTARPRKRPQRLTVKSRVR